MRGTLIIAGLTLALLVPFAVFGDQPERDPPWTGIWTWDPEWCVYKDRIGSHNPAPILITPDEIGGLENFCDITSVTEIEGMGAWHMTLLCSSEGSAYDDSTILYLRLGGDELWRIVPGSEPTRFTRCED